MKKIVCLIFIFVLAIGINSCREEIVDVTEDSGQLSLAEAKAWLDAQYPVNLELKSGGEKVKKYRLAQLWEKARRDEDNQYFVVEVPLKSDHRFAFLSEEIMDLIQATGNYQYAQSETRLLIRKNKESNEISAHFMTISGDAEYLDKTDFKVNKNSYLKKEKDFSGRILFHNLDGSFNIGWKYYNGDITHRITGHAESGLQLKQALVEDADHCVNIMIYETITHYIEYESGAIRILSVETNILDFYTECYYSGSVGGGGAPSNTYDSNSEYNCGCPVCPECGKCLVLLKGAFIPPDDNDDPINENDPVPTGTTTTTNSESYDCPMCSCRPDGISIELWEQFMGQGATYMNDLELSQLLLNESDNSDLTTILAGMLGTATGIGSLITSGAISTLWTVGGLYLTVQGTAFTLDLSRMDSEFHDVLSNYFGDMNNSETLGVFQIINTYTGPSGGSIHYSYYSAETGSLLGTVIQTF